MPRKPTNRRQFLKSRPSTFSPFSRSVARLTSAHMIKQQTEKSKLHERSFPNSTGNGLRDTADEEDDSGQSHSSDDEELEGTFQADFDFCEPKPSYFHGLKVLLQTYLDDKQWDISGFADLILEQTTVGTIIKIDGDEDGTPYCFVTALNMGRYKDHKCIKELKEYLLTVCKEQQTLGYLRSFLEEQAPAVGLIVCQRFINLPNQLLPPLYDTLFDEIGSASEDEPTKELRESFCFKHYLLITRIYELKNPRQKKAAGNNSEEDIIYIKAEDEIFLELSKWSFKFPLHTGKASDPELKNYRLMGLVMAVEAEKVAKFRQELHSLVDES